MIALAVAAVLVVGGGALVMGGGGDDEQSAPDGTSSTTGIASDQGGAPSGADGEGEGSSASDGDGGGSPGGGPAPAVTSANPEVIVEAFLAATVEGDCETQVSLTTENMLSGMTPEMAIEECELMFESDDSAAPIYAGMELIDPQIDGDIATVTGMGELDGTPLQMTFTLVRDDDAGWLIDDIA